jgi:hypothetical protein
MTWKRLSVPLADISFLAAYLFFSWLSPHLQEGGGYHPLFALRIGIFTQLVYPLVCLGMVDAVARNAGARQSMAALGRFFGRWYGIPLAWIFWISLLCHGTVMGTSAMFAGMLGSGDAWEGAGPLDYVLTVAGMTVLVGAALRLLSLASGIGWKQIRAGWTGFITSWRTAGKAGRILILLFAPLAMAFVLPIAAAILLCAPFYLLVIAWGFLFVRVKQEGAIPSPLSDRPALRRTRDVLFLVYPVLMAFFLEMVVGHLAAIHASSPSVFSAAFYSIFIFIFFYFPYRIFLAARRLSGAVGWITLLAGSALGLYQTWLRFAG